MSMLGNVGAHLGAKIVTSLHAATGGGGGAGSAGSAGGWNFDGLYKWMQDNPLKLGAAIIGLAVVFGARSLQLTKVVKMAAVAVIGFFLFFGGDVMQGIAQWAAAAFFPHGG